MPIFALPISKTQRPALGLMPMKGVHAEEIQAAAGVGKGVKVVVLGGGIGGLVSAYEMRKLGYDVTVLEALPQPMVRGLGPVLGEACAQLHREHGVDLRLGIGVEGIEGDGRVERVRLADGSAVDADVVIVGVGVVPVTDWLEGSGLTIDNGVVCDETCLAAPGIVAAGDVARWPNPLFDGELMRLEHWTNATEQAVYAAHRLLGATLTGRGVTAMVVEVEAYGGGPDGPWPDAAAHSYRGGLSYSCT